MKASWEYVKPLTKQCCNNIVSVWLFSLGSWKNESAVSVCNIVWNTTSEYLCKIQNHKTKSEMAAFSFNYYFFTYLLHWPECFVETWMFPSLLSGMGSILWRGLKMKSDISWILPYAWCYHHPSKLCRWDTIVIRGFCGWVYASLCFPLGSMQSTFLNKKTEPRK